jgi:hypothetical protein
VKLAGAIAIGLLTIGAKTATACTPIPQSPAVLCSKPIYQKGAESVPGVHVLHPAGAFKELAARGVVMTLSNSKFKSLDTWSTSYKSLDEVSRVSAGQFEKDGRKGTMFAVHKQDRKKDGTLRHESTDYLSAVQIEGAVLMFAVTHDGPRQPPEMIEWVQHMWPDAIQFPGTS